MKSYKIGDLGSVVTGRTPSSSIADCFGDKFPFITPADMHDRKNAYPTERSLSDKGAELLKRNLLPPGSVAVSCIGWQMGKSILVTHPSFTNQQLNAVIPNELVDSDYLYYLLTTKRDEFFSIGSAAGVRTPILNKSVFCNTDVMLPELDVQIDVAGILSAYDSLIENNNRRIAILESMAQSLYREWFVNFRFPGHENCKFVDSPLGKVPEGWGVKRLFDISEATYGCAFKSSLFNSDGNGEPVVRIRDINNNATKTYTQEKPKKIEQILRNGDLLIGMDGDFHMGKWAGGHALLNQRVVKISAKAGYSPYFVFLSMQKPISELNKAIVGTTVAHLGDSHLREVLVFDPGNKLMGMANSLLDSIFLQEINLRVRNCNLKRQRDMLLPRLVSGQIELVNQ